jgi:hypothetical protein
MAWCLVKHRDTFTFTSLNRNSALTSCLKIRQDEVFLIHDDDGIRRFSLYRVQEKSSIHLAFGDPRFVRQQFNTEEVFAGVYSSLSLGYVHTNLFSCVIFFFFCQGDIYKCGRESGDYKTTVINSNFIYCCLGDYKKDNN